jgi:hypothetical protein
MDRPTSPRPWSRARIDAALRQLEARIPELMRACARPEQFAMALRLATAEIDAHAGPHRRYADRRIDTALANLTRGTPTRMLQRRDPRH